MYLKNIKILLHKANTTNEDYFKKKPAVIFALLFILGGLILTILLKIFSFTFDLFDSIYIYNNIKIILPILFIILTLLSFAFIKFVYLLSGTTLLIKDKYIKSK